MSILQQCAVRRIVAVLEDERKVCSSRTLSNTEDSEAPAIDHNTTRFDSHRARVAPYNRPWLVAHRLMSGRSEPQTCRSDGYIRRAPPTALANVATSLQPSADLCPYRSTLTRRSR